MRPATVAALTGAFGFYAPTSAPGWLILGLATVLQLLAYELAYWFGHYLFHKVPALWEFHKVHHSAEVMTTLTELRQHPVEIVAFMNLIGLATGIVFGLMTYAFGPGVRPFTLLNGNILLVAFLITYGHLRHSHMWIPFTGLAARILQSPAHHQLHHSADPADYGKNLGFALAVWDWAFGTLAIPTRERRPLVFGVGDDNRLFRSALSAYLMPWARAGERIAAFSWKPGASMRAKQARYREVGGMRT
jgi:sterol desaturase/sphingolipid hydroxylase (fatty acid hydroxylase superfamily)